MENQDVWVKLQDVYQVMDGLRKTDLEETFDVPMPDTFNASRAKNALKYIPWTSGMVKPIKCAKCIHKKVKPLDASTTIKDCAKRPGGYLGDDGYCSLGETEIER